MLCLPLLESAKTGERVQGMSMRILLNIQTRQRDNTDFLCSHLIQSKANGVHVLTLTSISAPVFLHEGY